MPLLPIDAFGEIFEPLRGQRVALTEGQGFNPGDLLLYRATEQLCEAFDIVWQAKIDATVDHVLLFAGGNVMGPYGNEIKDRWIAIRAAIKLGKPMTLLPQSIWKPIRDSYAYRSPPAFVCEWLRPVERIFARESVSRGLCLRAKLAPDLALGYAFPSPPDNEQLTPERHILRVDTESVAKRAGGDPIRPRDLAGFIRHARSAEHVYTDRLHVAVTALAHGRRVTLIGNSYHKNHAMWLTWLADLGCDYLTPAEYLSKFR